MIDEEFVLSLFRDIALNRPSKHIVVCSVYLNFGTRSQVKVVLHKWKRMIINHEGVYCQSFIYRYLKLELTVFNGVGSNQVTDSIFKFVQSYYFLFRKRLATTGDHCYALLGFIYCFFVMWPYLFIRCCNCGCCC